MESEDLLILTLNQLGILKEDDPSHKISSVAQIKDDQFRDALIKVINKIIQIKNLDVQFPEKASLEMNKRFQEAQKTVEILKSLGFRGDVGMNNILHPEKRDKERLLEFTLEIISSEEVGTHEITQGMNEKNLIKMKIEKTLFEWQKDLWLIPELNPATVRCPKNKKKEFILKVSESKTKELKNIIKSSGLDKDFIQAGHETSKKVASSNEITFITEEDNQLSKYTSNEKNHNYLINKLKKRKNIKKFQKNTNQLLIESLDKRGKALQFLYQNYTENNFKNNVSIIKKKNKDLYFSQSGINLPNNSNNEAKKEEENQNADDSQQIYKNKLDAIISNFESEKKAKNDEINELNNKLLNITNNIDNLKRSHADNINLKNNLLEQLSQLSLQNTELIKEIEDQMAAYEQMKKLQKNEIQENEVVAEVEKLEKKYQDMVTNWTDYANETKNQIQVLKSSIDEKKKEYKYKYDQINKLKKEIEEIANKISMKQELAQFLHDEYGKITVHINRNIFVNKISDLTKKINDQRRDVSQYLAELKATDKKIELMNATIKSVDNDLEDIIFKDAKSNPKLKEVYTAFMNLRDGYNLCQKNIIEVSIQKNKNTELSNQVEDYKEKIQNYDIKQLTEQIELLKQTNKKGPANIKKSANIEKPTNKEKLDTIEKPVNIGKLANIENPTIIEKTDNIQKQVNLEKIVDIEKPANAEKSNNIEKPLSQSSSLNIKNEIEPVLVGLNNIGATCFMNSTLQCLSQTKPLTDYFLNPNNENIIINNNIAMNNKKENKNDLQLSPVYLDLIKKLWDKDGPSSFSPTEFRTRVEQMNPLFKEGQPGDSKDFIIFILEQIHKELKKPNESNNKEPSEPYNQYDKNISFNHFFYEFNNEISVISNIFFGFNETTNECLYCKNYYNSQGCSNPICYNYGTFNCIIFPLEEVKNMKNNYMQNSMNYNIYNSANSIQGNQINSVTIYECFQFNQKTEYFSGENRNYCNNCRQLYDSIYISKILSSPNILILILNRGKGNIFNIKLEFNEIIDLTQFVMLKDKPQIFYSLYGVITHIGQSGPNAHFVASCKSQIDNKWYRFNDAFVNPINDFQKEVINFETPYILFYQKN